MVVCPQTKQGPHSICDLAAVVRSTLQFSWQPTFFNRLICGNVQCSCHYNAVYTPSVTATALLFAVPVARLCRRNVAIGMWKVAQNSPLLNNRPHGWTAVDMSIPISPEVVPEIRAYPVSFLRAVSQVRCRLRLELDSPIWKIRRIRRICCFC